MGRRAEKSGESQHIRLVKFLYCKLLTNDKQAFPLGGQTRTQTPISEVVRECVATVPLLPLIFCDL